MKRFASIFAMGLAATLTLSACGAQDAVEGTVDGVTGAVEGAAEVAGDVAGSATDTAGNVAAGAADAAGGAVDAAGNAAGGAVDAVTGGAGGAADSLMAMKDGVTGMTGSITSTVDAVQSGDFAAAKESFAGVETAWGNVKGLVPADATSGIEEKIAEVSTGLAADAPDADSIVSSLGGLTDMIGGLAVN